MADHDFGDHQRTFNFDCTRDHHSQPTNVTVQRLSHRDRDVAYFDDWDGTRDELN